MCVIIVWNVLTSGWIFPCLTHARTSKIIVTKSTKPFGWWLTKRAPRTRIRHTTIPICVSRALLKNKSPALKFLVAIAYQRNGCLYARKGGVYLSLYHWRVPFSEQLDPIRKGPCQFYFWWKTIPWQVFQCNRRYFLANFNRNINSWSIKSFKSTFICYLNN